MALLDTMTSSFQGLAGSRLSLNLGVPVMVFAIATYLWTRPTNGVPALPGTIPYVSTGYQYMTDMRSFLQLASRELRKEHIAKFHLGPMKVYLITGAQHVQALFRTSRSVGSDKFMLLVMENIWGATKKDLAKFVNDKSGRLKTPAPGTETTSESERYWAGSHHIFHNYLARTPETNKLAKLFQRQFDERLEKFPVGEWTTVRVFEFFKQDMAAAAIISLAGPRILELNPGFIDILWKFDQVAASLVWGLPKWMNREACNKRDRYRDACGKYLETGCASFDWDGPDADADWEPIFGARYSREYVKWMRQSGFDAQTAAGAYSNSIIFGQNSNTIPVTTWCIIELARDPSTFQAVREEVATAVVTDPETQNRTIDMQKLLSQPLLQSIYTEALRLHVSINITREVLEPFSLGGHMIEKGAILQAPSEIAHYDESIWGVEGHPASEFWAARHVKYVEETDETGQLKVVPQFNLAGRVNNFLPYGGGVSMCPGRFFAKQEIMLGVAMIVSRFDIEVLEWVNLDGSPSERAAENDERWAGGAAVPPDRDLKVQWKRLY